MHGKVVAITGASRGIGAAAARVFVQAGAQVALMARDADALQMLAAELGAQAMALPCDVADAGSVSAAIDTIIAKWGRLDVLVNNAGMIDPIARLADARAEDWSRAIDVNLKGVFHGVQAALPVMRAQGSGTVLTVSSGAAHKPYEGWSAYCCGKAGAAMLTRALHLEEGDWLRVMGLSPGTVATEMQRRIRASGVNPVSQIDWADHIPADWPARALLWMCGTAADPHRGTELSLRDETLRKEIGLT